MNTTNNEFDIPKFKFDLEQNKHIKTVRKELDLDSNETAQLMNILQDVPLDHNLDLRGVEESLSIKLVEDTLVNKTKLFNKKPKAALAK